MATTSHRGAWRTVAITVLGAALALTACGSDDDSEAANDDAGAVPDDGTSSTDAPPVDGVVEVELADFAFEGLPDSVVAGTRLTVTNSSEDELHKLSALPLPDGENRPVESWSPCLAPSWRRSFACFPPPCWPRARVVPRSMSSATERSAHQAATR